MDHTVYPYLISFSNSNVYCNDVTNNGNNIVNVNKVMQWLSPLGPSGRHQDVRTDREFAFGNKGGLGGEEK